MRSSRILAESTRLTAGEPEGDAVTEIDPVAETDGVVVAEGDGVSLGDAPYDSVEEGVAVVDADAERLRSKQEGQQGTCGTSCERASARSQGKGVAGDYGVLTCSSRTVSLTARASWTRSATATASATWSPN
jgi:hypothetical protein